MGVSNQKSFKLPYKVYSATVFQNGDSAPTQQVFQNTLSENNISWAYDSVGRYIGTLSSSFIENKTFLFISGVSSNGDCLEAGIVWVNQNEIAIECYGMIDGTIQPVEMTSYGGVAIEIRVYP